MADFGVTGPYFFEDGGYVVTVNYDCYVFILHKLLLARKLPKDTARHGMTCNTELLG